MDIRHVWLAVPAFIILLSAEPLVSEEGAKGTRQSAGAPNGLLIEGPVIRGNGRVSLIKSGGKWQLLVDRKNYIVKGVEYSADTVGSRPKESNTWMNDDFNSNGRRDGPYEAWLDENKNEYQDQNEYPIGDFMLLKRMGCNTIRIYHPQNIRGEILRDLYKNYGIMSIMGNFVGAYTVDTGAEWKKGTDYTSKSQKQKMLQSVENMVEKYKDEPFVLMWMLGNENDSVGSYENSTFNNTNARKKPEAFAKFVGEVARRIKELDPDHPVGICLANYSLLPYLNKYAPEVDIVGMNAYSGAYGFGAMWGRVKSVFDRPVMLTEYGVDAWNQKKQKTDEEFQERYHRKAWMDIIENSYFGDKAGNSIGGVVFCWLDKWWLCGSPLAHDTDIGAWEGPSNDGMFNDEWIGICSQGNGSKSPFLRQPRKIYYAYKEMWNLPLEELELDMIKRRKMTMEGRSPGK